jgi:hypothetical protein
MRGVELPSRQKIIIPTWQDRKDREREEKKRAPLFTGPPKPAAGEA